MAHTIYLVEEDPESSSPVAVYLQGAGYRVRRFAETTGAVLAEAEKDRPLLFLLDVSRRQEEALELCRRIRSLATLTPAAIIFLTARTSEADRIVGLEVGADDYIIKPFSAREFLARVKAVLRATDVRPPAQTLRVGEMEIDSGSMQLSVAGRPVVLTVREFRLLEYLAKHAGRVFSRHQLLQAIWPEPANVTSRAVDVFVRRVRRKIEDQPANPRYLKSIRGVGYRLDRG